MKLMNMVLIRTECPFRLNGTVAGKFQFRILRLMSES